MNGVNDKGVVDDSMDIDKGPIEASVSSSSKQKHSLNTGTSSLTFGHVTSVPATFVTSFEPANKKLNFSKDKGKQPVKLSSSSAGHKISAAKVAQISNTTVLHGMQGTMNWVTDIFERSVS